MKRLLAVRIVQTQFKVVYWLGALLIAFGINTGLSYIGLPRVIGTPLAALLTLGIYLYGGRVFRGPGEPIAPPRAWWRMTAARRVSAFFGVVFLLSSTIELRQLLVAVPQVATGAQFGPAYLGAAQGQEVYSATYLALMLFLSAWYFNSAVRITPPVELPARRLA
jgi:hypothetical protein